MLRCTVTWTLKIPSFHLEGRYVLTNYLQLWVWPRIFLHPNKFERASEPAKPHVFTFIKTAVNHQLGRREISWMKNYGLSFSRLETSCTSWPLKRGTNMQSRNVCNKLPMLRNMPEESISRIHSGRSLKTGCEKFVFHLVLVMWPYVTDNLVFIWWLLWWTDKKIELNLLL